MAKRIELDGEVHEFPDDFTDDDISSALGGKPSFERGSLPALPGEPSTEPTTQGRGEGALDQIKRIVGSVAGPAAGGLAALGEVGLSGLTGVGAAGANLANFATGAKQLVKNPGERTSIFTDVLAGNRLMPRA